MAGKTSRSDEKDVISDLAVLGEETIRWVVYLPRRIAAGTMHGVGRRLQGVATKLGAVDPLDGRVGAIEKRLDALEQPKRKTAATASGRATPPNAKASAPTPERDQTELDAGLTDDARMGEPKQGEVPA